MNTRLKPTGVLINHPAVWLESALNQIGLFVRSSYPFNCDGLTTTHI